MIVLVIYEIKLCKISVLRTYVHLLLPGSVYAMWPADRVVSNARNMVGILGICIPAKILSAFLPIAPLQYVTKILVTQATIDGFTTDKTKNVLFNETVNLNYIDGEPV